LIDFVLILMSEGSLPECHDGIRIPAQVETKSINFPESDRTQAAPTPSALAACDGAASVRPIADQEGVQGESVSPR
jgi:hypothetical protein